MIGLQVLHDLADQTQRQTAVHGCQGSASATVVHVGTGFQSAVNDQLVNKRHALANLLDHFAWNVIFVQVVRLVGESVQA